MAPDSGARFSSAWNAHIDRIFTDARKAGRREPRGAYAADALVALATEGSCKPVEVRLNVDAGVLVRGHAKPNERCDLTGIGPVPAAAARALLDDAVVSVLVADGDDIATISKATRTIPARLRRGAEARYPTCGVRGCANDRFLLTDHVVALADGGLTEDGNLWRLCTFHHDKKTYAGWKVVGTTHNRNLVPPDNDPDPP